MRYLKYLFIIPIFLVVLFIPNNVYSTNQIVPDFNYNKTVKELPFPWSPVTWGRAINAPNLIPDPSIENGTLWSFANGGGLDSSFSHNGSQSAYIDSTGYVGKWGDVFSPKIAIKPNTVYALSLWVYTDTNGYSRHVRIDWFNKSLVYLGYSDKIYFGLAYHNWTQIYLLAKSPPNAYYAQIRVTQYNAVNHSIVHVDDFNLHIFNAFVLDKGSFYQPYPVSVNKLPTTITLRAKVIINQSWVTTNLTNWKVLLEGKPLTIDSVKYNSTSGWWEIKVNLPKLNVGVYNISVYTTDSNNGWIFYTKGKIWVYNPKEFNDLVIVHTSDNHLYSPYTLREGENSTNYVNTMYYAKLAVQLGADIVIDTGDWGDTYTMRPFINYVNYLNAHGIPVYMVAGNHEGWPKYGINITQSSYWEITRQIGDPDRYYTLDLGKYELIAMWSDEYGHGSGHANISYSQLNWFLDQLKKYTKEGKKIIVAFHTPVLEPYIGVTTEWDNTTEQHIILNAINNSSTIIVLNGHDHGNTPGIAYKNDTHIYWVMTLGYAKLVGSHPDSYSGITVIRLNNSSEYLNFLKVFRFSKAVGANALDLFQNRTFLINKTKNYIEVAISSEDLKYLPMQTDNNSLYLNTTLFYHPHAHNVLLLKNIKIGHNYYKRIPSKVESDGNVSITVDDYSKKFIVFDAKGEHGKTAVIEFDDMPKFRKYALFVDGRYVGMLKSDRFGRLILKWQSWSKHRFEIVAISSPTSSTINIHRKPPIILYLAALYIFIVSVIIILSYK